MTLISRYIFKEFMSLVLGVLTAILVVYLCVEFLQRADKFIKYHATALQMTKYFMYSVPRMITMSLPMAALIAALLALGGLSRHNELIAMRAAGIGLTRIVAPLLAGGLLLSAFGFINSELITPIYSGRANYTKAVEIEGKQQRVMFQQQKLWLRGPDNSIANIEFVAPDKSEMLGLSIYKLNPDFSVRERTKAGSLVWENNAWRLRQSFTFTPLNGGVRSRVSDGEVYNIVEGPDDLGMIVKGSDEMNFSELWDYVKRLKASGYKAVEYEVDLYGKLAFPFANLLMVLISIPFSINKVRTGGPAKGFAMAVLIAFFYWALMSVGTSLGSSGTLPPFAAAWLANVLFMAAAVIVMVRLHRAV